MNKNLIYGGFMSVFLMVIAGFYFSGSSENRAEPEKTSMRIGVLLYQGEDTFISTLKASMEDYAKKYEMEHDIKVTLDIMDAKGNQNTQNNQAERLIALGCDVLCVNMVDRSVASGVIDKAMDADIPVIFFNREPVEEDLNRWEKIYYVGVDAKETAVLQGQMLVDAYREDPKKLDRNGDGKVSYVLLEGESNHQDSLIRTEWSIQTLKDGGVPLEKLTGGIANWERSQASALMEQWLKDYAGEIELAICNNDDMALGAIDAMDRNGIDPDAVCLVGIDGTPVGLSAVESGKLFGTVVCDKERYAKEILDLAAGLSLNEDMSGFEKYFWCPQYALVSENG